MPELPPDPMTFKAGTKVTVNGQPGTVVGYMVVVNLEFPDGAVKPAFIPVGVPALPPVEVEAAALHILPMNGNNHGRQEKSG